MLRILQVFGLLLVYFVTFCGSCEESNDAKMSNPSTDQTSNLTSGVISDTLAEQGCPWVIRLDSEDEEYVDPTNLPEEFRKTGTHIEFSMQLSRAMERCSGVKRVSLSDIKLIEE